MKVVTIVPNPSLSDQAFTAIVHAISDGTIAPGERIKEAQLARSFGISRGPLREALRRLESQRLVERRRNLGVFVAGLSEEDLDDLFRMREALEGAACGLAAIRMTDEALQELNDMLDRHKVAIEQSGHYLQKTADDDFHFHIIRQSGSKRLFHALCTELYLQIRLYRFRSSSKPGRAEAAMQEHREIVAALATRNARTAEEAMRTHIANARKNLLWAGQADPIEEPILHGALS